MRVASITNMSFRFVSPTGWKRPETVDWVAAWAETVFNRVTALAVPLLLRIFG